MNKYSVSGPTAATAATADNGIAGLWNPSTTKRIFLKEIHVFKTTAGAADIPRIRRTSARGTASTSFTPTSAYDYDVLSAPESGAILDLAYSVQPTFTGTASRGLLGALIPAAIGAGFVWVLEPVERAFQIPAGTGLCVVTGSALAFPISEVAFVWYE